MVSPWSRGSTEVRLSSIVGVYQDDPVPKSFRNAVEVVNNQPSKRHRNATVLTTPGGDRGFPGVLLYTGQTPSRLPSVWMEGKPCRDIRLVEVHAGLVRRGRGGRGAAIGAGVERRSSRGQRLRRGAVEAVGGGPTHHREGTDG